MNEETWNTGDPYSSLHGSGPASGWLLFVPTWAPEGGFYARVRLSHRTQEVFVTCSDAGGVFLKQFAAIEDYIAWLDGIAQGPVQSLPAHMPLPRVDEFRSLAG